MEETLNRKVDRHYNTGSMTHCPKMKYREEPVKTLLLCSATEARV